MYEGCGRQAFSCFCGHFQHEASVIAVDNVEGLLSSFHFGSSTTVPCDLLFFFSYFTALYAMICLS